jgi:hypothetical protein
MKRTILFLSVLLSSMFLAGCGGEGGGMRLAEQATPSGNARTLDHGGDMSSEGGDGAADDFALAGATSADAAAFDAPGMLEAESYAPADLAAPTELPRPSGERTAVPTTSDYRGKATSGTPPASGPARRAPATRAPAGDSGIAEGREAKAERARETARSATRPDDRRPDDRRPDDHRATRQRTIQSGLLTAGSFDDHENFDAYQKYLTKAMQQDSGETFPRYALGERVEIQVVDAQDRPVGGAKLVVRTTGQAHEELLSTVTGSDGRAVFCTGLDKAASRAEHELAVTPPGGADESVATFRVAERPWRFRLDTEAALPRQLDLALVIDTTGSMGDELEYLKVEIDSIVETVSRMFPNVDQRYALIVYRDRGDEYVSRTFDFMSSLDDLRSHLAAQSAGGGGDYPEAVQVAVEHAGKLNWREDNTARVMFLVGDAPPHDEYLAAALDATQVLRRRGVHVYPVGGSGVAQKAQFVFRAMSFLTMGQYLFLTDHSGVGNPHARPDVPEFQVERLDRLMIRMISSELAGKRLAPTEVIAIERGDLAPSEPPILEQNEALDGQVLPARPEESGRSPNLPEAGAEQAAASSGSLPALAANPLAWIALAAVVCAVFIGDAIRDRARGAE